MCPRVTSQLHIAAIPRQMKAVMGTQPMLGAQVISELTQSTFHPNFFALIPSPISGLDREGMNDYALRREMN